MAGCNKESTENNSGTLEADNIHINDACVPQSKIFISSYAADEKDAHMSFLLPADELVDLNLPCAGYS